MHYIFRSWLQGGRIAFSSTTLSIVIALLITAGCDNSTESDSSGADSPANSTNTANDSGDNEQQASDESAISPAAEGSVRFAAYNISFYRDQSGDLVRELENGDSLPIRKITEVIQITRPDVLLLNEFDYDEDGAAAALFQNNYLLVSQNGHEPIEYAYSYFAPVNTGVDTGLDLDGNGQTGTPNDAYGFGKHPGQYGMLVLSKYEIDTDNVRTFQNFLWKDMPDAKWPMIAATAQPYYSEEVQQIFRLSSKSHWDIPVKLSDDKVVHFLVCHPTPPVFDGNEDRNGCRNHDEIRLFADYVSGGADYLYDDNGVKGGLAEGEHFVIAGDLNADPFDGDSLNSAVRQLTESPAVNDIAPVSTGGKHYADEAGGQNRFHTGDPAADTSAWRTGHMRVDYCLPSKTLNVTASGVFWPLPGQQGADAVTATDHRMVWIDVEK